MKATFKKAKHILDVSSDKDPVYFDNRSKSLFFYPEPDRSKRVNLIKINRHGVYILGYQPLLPENDTVYYQCLAGRYAGKKDLLDQHLTQKPTTL